MLKPFYYIKKQGNIMIICISITQIYYRYIGYNKMEVITTTECDAFVGSMPTQLYNIVLIIFSTVQNAAQSSVINKQCLEFRWNRETEYRVQYGVQLFTRNTNVTGFHYFSDILFFQTLKYQTFRYFIQQNTIYNHRNVVK